MTTAGLTWQQLRDLKLSQLEDVGDRWNEVSGRSDASRTQVDRAMSARLRETQESESAEAALGRLKRLSRNFHYLHTECGLVRTTLNGLASELAEPQRQLRQALEDAAALKFSVLEDGSISYPAVVTETLTGDQREASGGKVQGSARLPVEPPGWGGNAPSPFQPLNPNAEKAQVIADQIARAVRAAVEIDVRYARTLDRLKAAKGLDVTEAVLQDVMHDMDAVRTAADRYLDSGIPQSKSPAENKVWWDGLSEEQRQEYLEIAPDLVGGLDGVPVIARDEANRNYLPVLIDSLARQDGDEAHSKLDALQLIDEKLKRPGHPPMFLLGIGDEGNGRAIIAYGNPDMSRNVSAYVPGLGTKLNKDFVEGTMKRAQDTALGAQNIDPSSASIVWLGYDAPQSVDVMGTGDAKKGAPSYNHFMAGLEATNEHSDPHLTAIGHSYGSLTVGTAAKQAGGIPGADDIILLGSPGVGVDNAQDLGVGKKHVFVGSAENDPVTHLPTKEEAFFAGPLGVLVYGDAFDRGNDDIYFGKDPASEAFGAQRFKVDPGPRPILEMGGFDAHSQYFTPEKDMVSAENIATIVAGRPEDVIRDGYR
ncbi:alpha/beta hydrolase [Streptomyces sp. PTD5-9]|uniref:alpha/beta hydrolase n=1 Tax=Streptomyces sp. PTD5-9 TaxID=3120150 RepID=UPI0030099571